jgi:hypothetical protein
MPSTFNTAAALSRIEALAYCFSNADARAMEEAAANLANNCPAFWHRATGGNAVVGGFMFYLNKAQDVARAWGLYEAEFHTDSRMRKARLLDELLPLNRAAAESLADAYEEAAPVTFRTPSELLSRTYHCEGEALAALRKLGDKAPSPLIEALGGLDYSRIDDAARALNTDALAPTSADEEIAA